MSNTTTPIPTRIENAWCALNRAGDPLLGMAFAYISGRLQFLSEDRGVIDREQIAAVWEEAAKKWGR